MKILLASSEIHPYSKTGGLADMVGALAGSLARAGHEVSVVTPLYQGILERFNDITLFEWELNLPLGAEYFRGEIYRREVEKNLIYYFVHQPAFFQRKALYQDRGVDYPDNAERFLFFSKAVVHLARFLPDPPELVHVHDWQVGLVPLMILHQKLASGWSQAPRTCLTIHNLAYQGLFPRSAYELTNLPHDYFNPHGVEFYNHLNCLKGGIIYADILTTVSPRYAREITTEQFGCGLDGILRKRQPVLAGILNGVDYYEWNTSENPYLKHSFSVENLDGKQDEKCSLQREMGLPVAAKVPIFANITRLADQKGVDIQLSALEEMLSADIQFMLLGSGSTKFENAYKKLAARHPEKVSVRLGFDQGLSHRIEAGADFYLMPSKFEPCGLNQMYSLRYGTVPIVRITGGLDDSVTDISENVDEANGIKFMQYSARALAKAMRKALVIFEEPDLLEFYRVNGMRRDFSWDRTAQEYEAWYRKGV